MNSGHPESECRPPSPMRVDPEGSLMISRRSFLIGLGSFLTPPFVVRARRYALATGTPLPLDGFRSNQSHPSQRREPDF
jgi:hypothetical protein